MNIEISEMFVAPQGEGPGLGRVSLFVRSRRCNLQCSWCDSKFTWDANDPAINDYTVFTDRHEMVGRMYETVGRNFNLPALVITGGEPLLWQREWPSIIDEYGLRGFDHRAAFVEVETAGTIVPSPDMLSRCHFNVSHKLSSSKNVMRQERLWNRDALRAIYKETTFCLKPVVGPDDIHALEVYLEWVDDVLGEHGRDFVYLMPEGRSRDEIAWTQRLVTELAIKHGTNVTTRMHVLAYGDERGH